MKGYREILYTKSYTTVRNWMIKDFPKIASQMTGGDTEMNTGGLRDIDAKHPGEELLAGGMQGVANAAAAARGNQGPKRPGALVEQLRTALATAETAGPDELPDDDF
jgi:hypothetical protein